MTLLEQIIEPLVQDDISLQPDTEFFAVRTRKAAKFGMAMVLAETHRLRKPPIEVSTYHHVRVGDSTVVSVEKIGQRERYRISSSIEDLDVQIAVSGNTRPEAAVEAFELGHQLKQAEIVTLIKRHQTDKTSRIDYRLGH